MNPRIRAALAHFQKKDKVLFSIAKKVVIEPIELRKTSEYFRSLCYEIIGQQLAKNAARTIFGRFENLFPNGKITPEYALKLSEEAIRNAGASWSKAGFVKDLAQKVADGTLDLKSIKRLDDSQAAEKLMQVKGIGPWTAQMFLMFTLGREDVFSHGDLGLRKAIVKLYSLDKDAAKNEIEEIAKKWSPYRTYACRILWKSLEL
ncbi:MAG: DNA-3-methyladenine glycosylase 2 family protein [Candidatus Aenigmatarchaeota archaeon]